MVVVSANVTALSYVHPAPSAIRRSSDLPPTTQDISFLGGDDLTLRGWYIPPKNGMVIILLHGYFSNRTEMIFAARHLTAAGYGALLYDERGSGESDGMQRSLGWRDVDDVGGALAFLDGKANQVGIAGCSIGGQIAVRAAARYPQISAVLADGAAMVSAEDLPPPQDWAERLIIPYDWLLDRFIEAHAGMAAPPSMMETISQIAPRPIMLFAAELSNEKFYIRRFQQAAGANAQLWEIPNATHCHGVFVAPDEYARRMLDFFDSSR